MAGQFEHLHRPMTHEEKWGKTNKSKARTKALKSEKTKKPMKMNSQANCMYGNHPHPGPHEWHD